MDEEAKRRMENKFVEYNENTTDELLVILDELEKESIFLDNEMEKASSQEKADIWNDIKYNNEKKAYINKLLQERYENEQNVLVGVKRK